MNEPAATTVTHTAALLAQPVCGSPAVALLEAGTIVQGAQAEHGFVLLQDPSGLAGYLPAALLGAAPAERSPSISVTHSATLFRSASIADTFGTRPIVARDEIVLLHERAGDFVKIARADGQAGFLPAALCQPLAVTAPSCRLRDGLGTIRFSSIFIRMPRPLQWGQAP